MPRLSQSELRGRLALDWRICREMTSPTLGPVRAFVSAADQRLGREASEAEGECGLATIYLVDYLFPVLVGEGRTARGFSARIDVLAGANYPFSAPAVTIASQPLPWSPHVHTGSGTYCIGEGWQTDGRTLLAHLIIHVARGLNCDEPDRGPGYRGWNADAIRYWREKLGCRPLNDDLEYPRLPRHLTHDRDAGSACFRAASAEVLDFERAPFRPVGVAPAPAGDAEFVEAAVFLPVAGGWR